MPFSSPRYISVQGAVGTNGPRARLRESDQAFIDAVQAEFPMVVARQDAVPADAPPNLPHLALQSTTSQLVVSAVRADFRKRFYGDYETSPDSCHEYMERKLRAVLEGWRATGGEPTFLGVVLTLTFPFDGTGMSPTDHILATQLRADTDPAQVQDAQARIGVRLDDKYYATFQVSNYETRSIERPVMPGVQQIDLDLKPWEGSVEESGVELTIDVNNRLQSFVDRSESVVSDEVLTGVLGLIRQAAAESGPRFVETGSFAVESMLPEGA